MKNRSPCCPQMSKINSNFQVKFNTGTTLE
jgi:hypothetical protein